MYEGSNVVSVSAVIVCAKKNETYLARAMGLSPEKAMNQSLPVDMLHLRSLSPVL
jgi:hypothetical protein